MWDNQYGADMRISMRNNIYVLPGLILGLRPANERRRCFVTTYLIGRAKNLESAVITNSHFYVVMRVLTNHHGEDWFV